jgi:hypothetical protein
MTTHPEPKSTFWVTRRVILEYPTLVVPAGDEVSACEEAVAFFRKNPLQLMRVPTVKIDYIARYSPVDDWD